MPGFDATVVIVEGIYGGTAQEWAEFDVELPCTVRPTILTTAPTALAEDEEPVAAEAA
jgi:hypothetical protein